ncbi:UDP-N-acetylmuramate dehydrogenase [Flavobacteriaceae bacterium]|nr:UDP-N-acetylmuramate dehydrogenase [Flavobacteriaceae bacterium]
MIKENVSLKNHNTFGIDAKTKFLVEIFSEGELLKILKSKIKGPFRVLGSGSNILLTKNYDGHTIIMKNKGIEVQDQTKTEVLIKVGAGEVWHDLVLWALKNDYSGIENLALIPGSVGAAPIQNIGAYGVELNSVFKSCRALEISSLKFKNYEKESCKFEYRSSIFKEELKGKVIITSVCFLLRKKPHKINVSYGELQKLMIGKENTIQNVAAQVILIRKSKLPDPEKIGNSGSFFKNPIVTKKKLLALKKEFPEIPYYKESKNHFKLPAGWFIEKIGYKGKRKGDAGIHKKQALVLVNYGSAKGLEILALAEEVKEKIFNFYGLRLDFEVNLL